MIKTIRNVVVAGIHELTKAVVVNSDNEQRKPPYPYFSYKFTTLRQNSNERGNLKTSFVESNDSRFRNDVLEEMFFEPTTVISVSSYSRNSLEAQEYILKAWEWFKLQGKQELANNNLVVVEVSDIKDRTIQIADFYEFRQGFDVKIRYLHKFERRSETIEEHKIKEKKL